MGTWTSLNCVAVHFREQLTLTVGKLKIDMCVALSIVRLGWKSLRLGRPTPTIVGHCFNMLQLLDTALNLLQLLNTAFSMLHLLDTAAFPVGAYNCSCSRAFLCIQLQGVK